MSRNFINSHSKSYSFFSANSFNLSSLGGRATSSPPSPSSVSGLMLSNSGPKVSSSIGVIISRSDSSLTGDNRTRGMFRGLLASVAEPWKSTGTSRTSSIDSRNMSCFFRMHFVTFLSNANNRASTCGLSQSGP